MTYVRNIVTLLIVALLASCRLEDAGSNNDRLSAQYRKTIPSAVASVWVPAQASWKIAQGVADVQI